MNLDTFYKNAIKSIKCTLDEDGFLIKNTANGFVREQYDKKQILLYDSSIRLTNVDDIILFNPLEEDSIKGINPSMAKYKANVEKNLAYSFNVVTELLAVLAVDLDLQKKASLELNKFMSDLNKHRKANMKEIVDENFVKTLKNINNTSYTKSVNNSAIFIKTEKGKVLDGEKYNKVGVLSFPIYEDLLENPKEIYDVELKRNKDANIYYSIVEFIVGKNDDDKLDIEKYTVGSNSLVSPTFIIIHKLYLKLAKRLNALLKSLSFVDEEKANSGIINIPLIIEDLAVIDSLAGELKMIPNFNNQNKAAPVSSVSRMEQPLMSTASTLPAYTSPTGRTSITLPHESNIRQSNRPLTAAEKLRKANNLPIENYEVNNSYNRNLIREPEVIRPVPGLRPAPGLRREPPMRAEPIERPRIPLPGDDRRSFSPFRRESFNY